MAVRRHFPHIVATIVDVNGLLPFGMVVRKVLQCYVTTGSIAKLHNFLCQLAPVQAFAIAISQKAQGFGVVRQVHQLARFRNVPARCKGVEPMLHGRVILVGQEFVVACLQKASHDGRNRKAILRVVDSRLKKLGKGQATKAFVQLSPSASSAGNGHRHPAKEGDFIGAACGMSGLRCQMSWCVATTI